VETTAYLFAREHLKAFFWIRSMAQSGRDRRTKREPEKERRERRGKYANCNKPISLTGMLYTSIRRELGSVSETGG